MGSVIAFFSTVILGILPIRLSDIIYSCKWILSYISIRMHKMLVEDRLGFYDLTAEDRPDRVGLLSHANEEEMEYPHSESHLAGADDGVFFYGVNAAGDFLTVSINRLCNQKAEATINLRLASGKVYELVKSSDYQQSSADKNAFTCGGLQVYPLCPMKRWRIFYSGYLKETSDENPGVHEMTYVKFVFLWKASSDVYDNTSDFSGRELANSISREDWKSLTPPTKNLLKVLDFYGQAGTLHGTISIEDTGENYEIYLFGERMRCLGDVLTSKEIEFSHTLGFVHEKGIFVHFGQASVTNIAKNVNYGFIIKTNGTMRTVKKQDVSEITNSDATKVRKMNGLIEADRSYVFCGSFTRQIFSSSNKEKSLDVNQINFLFDCQKGTGVQIKGKYSISSSRNTSDCVSPVTIPECDYPMVVAFTEDPCQLEEITGGKGSSLGKLTSLSGELQTFTVPSGVVVTTSSYKRFVDAGILKEIKNLEEVLYGNKEGDPKEACKRVCNKIISSNLPSIVIDNIFKSLSKIFGDEYNTIRFAVRSSATGEDTEQMSAAGQMETFLGIKGLNNILSAVKECWASQFAFTAIQYKRRYGQCLNSPMAVVIQEMVACDVAGVCFTCDPLSGNGSKISIAANFGLGESVVSASVDPDTIELSRDASDELKIHKIATGQKSQRIVLTDGGTTCEENPENEREGCCLSTEDIFRLGNLAIKVEKYYRSKRDIEWGIKNGNLFLFQSRPVTTGTQETDFEIEHELDGALRIENDYFSVSNTGEVIPGAMTTLGEEIFYKFFNMSWQAEYITSMQTGVKARYFSTTWFTFYHHLTFSIPDMFHSSKPNERSNFDRAMMIAFFGRVIDEEEIMEVAYDRHSEEQMSAWKRALQIFKVLMFSKRRLRRDQKYYSNYRVPVEKYATSQELFNALMKCYDNAKPWMGHIHNTNASSIWNMLLLSILSQDKEEINTDVYTDFAKLITLRENVVSADVPAAIENLVLHISSSIKPEDFKAMKTEEALQWLKSTPSSAGKKFSEFLSNHGHRCLKEFDVYSSTWERDPMPLIQLLQRLVGTITTESQVKESTSTLKQISEIKTPLGLLSKLKLLFLVPLCRRGVQGREASKSLLVRHTDAWRKPLWALAKLMVSEGRIPDEKILFFMTLEDIQELLATRSPKVIAKAYHRQKLHPKVNEYKFPEIMRGVPKPMNKNEDKMNFLNGDASNISMQGIPVSQGVAKGYVRVAITLDEAAHLKPGEILLAYCTDIGWSPYFPTLAGVATELGGLISHGAVVSREYGLPCVAGLHGATRIFQTGDYVLLDGNKGVLQKIPPPEV